MKKRLLSVLLGITMITAMIPAAFAVDLEGHWARSFIEYLNQEGVINPSASTGEYGPNLEMTRAEFMRYINRAFHFTEEAEISFSDVQTNAWYYETIQIAVKYGYINGVGENRMDPLGAVTREQAAVVIGRLFKDDPGNVSSSDLPFSDRSEISSWAAGYVKAAVDKGIISGYDDGTFRPKRVVTRGEVAKILYYYLGTSLSTAGRAYTGADLKADTDNVTISESCTLSNAVVEGDLYITEGVGSDAVTLNNVTVNGTLIVSGGTVTMNNTESDHVIVSSPMGRLLQVTATGAASIRQTEVKTAAALNERGLSAEGDGFGDITVQGDSRVSLTLDATVNDLVLLGEATVSMSEDTLVYHMEARQAASVTGYGSVYQADIYVSGVSFASSVAVAGCQLEDGVFTIMGGEIVSTSSEAGIVPKSLRIDLYQLDELDNGIHISLPADVTVERVLCSGQILDELLDYSVTAMGIRLHAQWLNTLTRGEHTLALMLSNGESGSVTIEVVNTSPTADSHTASFDRYYGASGFRDVSVALDYVQSESDILNVVLGWNVIDEDDYSFSSATRELTFRRGVLAQLREGTYTITVELVDGSAERILLTVLDTAPAGETAIVRECDVNLIGDLSFLLPVGNEGISLVTAESDGYDLDEGSDDYWYDQNNLYLSREILQYYCDEGAYELFHAVLNNGEEYTLVVDYI